MVDGDSETRSKRALFDEEQSTTWSPLFDKSESGPRTRSAASLGSSPVDAGWLVCGIDDLTHFETVLIPISSDWQSWKGSSGARRRTPVELDTIASATPSSFGPRPVSSFGNIRGLRVCTLSRGPDFPIRDTVHLLEPVGNPLDLATGPS